MASLTPVPELSGSIFSNDPAVSRLLNPVVPEFEEVAAAIAQCHHQPLFLGVPQQPGAIVPEILPDERQSLEVETVAEAVGQRQQPAQLRNKIDEQSSQAIDRGKNVAAPLPLLRGIIGQQLPAKSGQGLPHGKKRAFWKY